MYIIGNFEDLESRAHQLTENEGDLNSYIAEASSYVNNIPDYFRQKWEREISKIEVEILGTNFYYSNGVPFTPTPPIPPVSIKAMKGVGGDSQFGVGGDDIIGVGE